MHQNQLRLDQKRELTTLPRPRLPSRIKKAHTSKGWEGGREGGEGEKGRENQERNWEERKEKEGDKRGEKRRER